MTAALVTIVKALRPIFKHDGMSTSCWSAIQPSVTAAGYNPVISHAVANQRMEEA